MTATSFTATTGAAMTVASMTGPGADMSAAGALDDLSRPDRHHPETAILYRFKKDGVVVSNIPFGVTEEQLTEVFEQAGRVVSFRLHFDRETKQPRGTGVCEYEDPEVAKSAVRNLNGYEVGGRALRVELADGGDAPASAAPAQPPPTRWGGFPEPPRPVGPPMMVPPPMPARLAPAVDPSQDAVLKTISSLSAQQLYDVVAAMKDMAQRDPEQARQLLSANPQLGFALLEAMALLKMVHPNTVHSFLISGPPPGPAVAAPYQGMPPMPRGPPGYLGGDPAMAPPPPAMLPPLAGGFYNPPNGPGGPPPPPLGAVPGPRYNEPPAQWAAGPPPPPMPVPAPTGGPPGGPAPGPPPFVVDPQDAFARSILSLTQEQLDKMPPDDRQKILLAKQQLLAMRQ